MKRLFKYLKPYAFFAIISPLLMIGEVGADLCLPQFMSVIVDCGIIAKGDVAESAIGSFVMRLLFGEGPYPAMTVIITFGVLMLLTVLVGGFFGVLCAYTASKASQCMGHDLRRDAYRRVMSLSIEQTDKFTTGSLVTRMTSDVSMVIDLTETILRMLVRSPMFSAPEITTTAWSVLKAVRPGLMNFSRRTAIPLRASSFTPALRIHSVKSPWKLPRMNFRHRIRTTVNF